MNLIAVAQKSEKQQSYASGQVIFRAGDRGDYLYIIIEGEVGIQSEGVKVRTIGPGDIFGEMSLIDDSPRSADAVAQTEARLALIDERQFLYLVHETPMFALNIMSIMADRLRNHLPS
jgi:CRP/FNR family cyclic AMP-dependent transcriptional regulator